MPRKRQPNETIRPKTKAIKEHTHLTPEGVFKSDKYGWCPDGFFALKFTDIVARVAIQHYANLIAPRDPQLYQDLTAAVEAAGSWTNAELDAALAPKHKHEWVDASNEAVESGEVCLVCGTVRKSA